MEQAVGAAVEFGGWPACFARGPSPARNGAAIATMTAARKTEDAKVLCIGNPLENFARQAGERQPGGGVQPHPASGQCALLVHSVNQYRVVRCGDGMAQLENRLAGSRGV